MWRRSLYKEPKLSSFLGSIEYLKMVFQVSSSKWEPVVINSHSLHPTRTNETLSMTGHIDLRPESCSALSATIGRFDISWSAASDV